MASPLNPLHGWTLAAALLGSVALSLPHSALAGEAHVEKTRTNEHGKTVTHTRDGNDTSRTVTQPNGNTHSREVVREDGTKTVTKTGPKGGSSVYVRDGNDTSRTVTHPNGTTNSREVVREDGVKTITKTDRQGDTVTREVPRHP